MGRISNQIRQLDVAGWGIAALICGALAVLSANLATFVPPNLLAGLHATRIQGGSFNQLRTQLAEVAEKTIQINREYSSLLTRFNLLDDHSGDAVRRLAAVEASLPLLIEALPVESDIDRGLLTASIGSAEEEVSSVEGGEMRIQRTELFPSNLDDVDEGQGSAAPQPMPPALAETVSEDIPLDPVSAEITGARQGVVIGELQSRGALGTAWEGIMREVGPLILGLEPRVVAADDGTNGQIVAGPLHDSSAAEALCTRIRRTGLACSPAPFLGMPLPPR